MGSAAFGPAIGPWACPLCGNRPAGPCLEVQGRRYAQCGGCALISLDPSHRLTPLLEVVRYAEHHNDAADAGYAAFLTRLAAPMTARLMPGARGLDFGCGPVPLLARLLTDAGVPTASYDPLFHPDDDLLAASYDFVSCCEVVEHLHEPATVFRRLAALLPGGGLLGVMTSFYTGDPPFADWWYWRDATHVCFYTEATMRWIAAHHGWTLEIPRPNVALFRLPATPAGRTSA